MSRARGFSLLELVVALAVLAVVSTLAFRGLGPMLDTQARVQSETRRWNAAARVMEQLGRDLSLALETPRLGRGGELLIHRSGDADGGVPHGPRQVGYRLRDGSLEYVTWTSTHPSVETAPSANAVLDHTTGIEWRALGDDGAWRPVLPVAQSAGAPRAIEVQIRFANGEHITRVFALR